MPSDPGPQAPEPRLLLVDSGGLSAASNTRLWAAMIAATAGLWLFGTGDGMVLASMALAAIAFAMIWTMGWVRQKVEHSQIEERYLQLKPDGMAVSDGRMLTTLDWSEVNAVSVDEDRLCVCIGIDNAEELRLDAPYEGVTPHELAEIIHQFHQHAKTCGDAPDA